MSQPQTESYTAAKGGIASLTHAMAVSLAGKVRVNSISPGWIETGIMFGTGAGLIEIFNNADDKLEKGVIRHFAFAVDDVDACVKAVTDAGYEGFMGPKDIVIPSNPEFPARMAFCYGPLGEEIEFFQEK